MGNCVQRENEKDDSIADTRLKQGQHSNEQNMRATILGQFQSHCPSAIEKSELLGNA
jgi:hypothetical protein